MDIYEVNNPYVPHSGNRYQVSQFGDIYDIETGSKLDLVEKDDGLYVDLDWVDGRCLYNAAMVILVSFRPHMKLPTKYYKDILPLYLNNNNRDLTPNNLTYKLPTRGVEFIHPAVRGFCYVPEYTGFAVSKEGIILDIEKFNFKSGPDKYKHSKVRSTYILINDHGIKHNLLMYRVVGITYLDYDISYRKLSINHIDGNCQNNSVSNLEWVTAKENVNHAFNTGLTTNNDRIDCKNYVTGKVTNYRSIKYACDDLGIDFRYFKKSLSIGFIKIKEHPKTWYYVKYEKDEWNDISGKEINKIPVKKDVEGTPIKALNVFTNNILIFSSIGDAVKKLSVDLAGIIYHINRDSLLPYHGYIFRYLNDDRSFPTFSEYQLYLIKHSLKNKEYSKVSQGYAVKDLQTNEKMVLTKTRDLMRFLDLGERPILSKLKNHGDVHVFNSRYEATLIKPEGIYINHR